MVWVLLEVGCGVVWVLLEVEYCGVWVLLEVKCGVGCCLRWSMEWCGCYLR